MSNPDTEPTESPGSVAPEPAAGKLEELFNLLARRMSGDYDVDEFGFDSELTENVTFRALRPLYRKWFNVEVTGIENVPNEGPALLVGNHSGTIALDALMVQLALFDEHPAERHLRLLAADFVFKAPLVG